LGQGNLAESKSQSFHAAGSANDVKRSPSSDLTNDDGKETITPNLHP
jgi:hypothetical protein